MNSKHHYYKEKLAIEKKIDELRNIQRNQNWVELDVPYKNGYYKFSDLRDDIKNRTDAWVFYECLVLVGERVWAKDKTFKRKIGKGKYEYYYPTFGEISSETYENLVPAVKKHFSEISSYHRNWNPFRKKYSCTVPPYYFVDKVKPKWITHYKEYDSVLVREEAEYNDYLSSKKFWPVSGWYGGAPKDFVKGYNRSDRRHGKQTLKRNIKNNDINDNYDDFDFDQLEDFEYFEYSYDFDRYEYRYNHRHSARWDYW